MHARDDSSMKHVVDARRHGQVSGSHTVQSVIRSFYTNTTLAASHVSADHKKVSTPDEGDIGRGTHEPAPVEAGGSSDVVPNLVMPDEKSGKAFQQAQDLLMSLLCTLKCWTQMLAAVAYLSTGFNAVVGKVPKGVEEVKGFKSGSGSTPELATQTTAKPVTIQLLVHAALECVLCLQWKIQSCSHQVVHLEFQLFPGSTADVLLLS